MEELQKELFKWQTVDVICPFCNSSNIKLQEIDYFYKLTSFDKFGYTCFDCQKKYEYLQRLTSDIKLPLP